MTNKLRQFLLRLKRRTAWIAVLVAALGHFLLELAKDRFNSSINGWLDEHRGWLMEHIRPILLWTLDHPIVWPVIVLGGLSIYEFWRRFHHLLQASPANTAVPFPAQFVPEIKPLPRHNAQWIGYESIEIAPGLTLATLRFQNVPVLGEEIGEFRYARVNVTYYMDSTGEEIASIFPVKWIDSDSTSIAFGVTPHCALLASSIGEKWTVDRLIHPSDGWEYGNIECIPLPLGRIRIVATLFGENNTSILPATGTLTLRENGIASFAQG